MWTAILPAEVFFGYLTVTSLLEPGTRVVGALFLAPMFVLISLITIMLAKLILAVERLG